MSDQTVLSAHFQCGQDVRVYRAHEVPDDLADAIENARMEPCFDHLNALIGK